MKKNILVTTALTYANGPLHLGHLVEQIQADIWVRTQRMLGNTCTFISGDDAHGTPIMLSAEAKKISPAAMITAIHAEHCQNLKSFFISCDNYHSTHSDENKEIVYEIYEQLQNAGLIYKKNIKQAYDTEKNMFLPDRYIKGTCPKCKAPEQYGDNCEHCGATYNPLELIDPYSIVSNTKPEEKDSEHYFFKLSKLQEQVYTWISDSPLQNSVKNKLLEWFKEDLRDWDISRDEPYFGFLIPNTTDKYFYVWLDAPIGYLASLQNLLEKHNGGSYNEFWQDAEIYHFIGKDITYFHGIFWPAILYGVNKKLPSAIYAHGFLTVDGRKMSKSKGTFITANDYLNTLNPEYLRYYFATRLSCGVDDIDLNWDDFVNKINTDLVGKVINIASRCSKFITNNFNNMLAQELDQPQLIAAFVAEKNVIIEHYSQRNFSQATAKIMQLADIANKYIAEQEPWKKIKNEENFLHVQQICSSAVNMFRILMLYLQPILPETAAKSMLFLNCQQNTMEDIEEMLNSHKINTYNHLLQRVTKDQIPG